MYESLPSQPDFPRMEEEILAFWQANRVFEKSLQQNEGKPPFVIYDGPPTANARPPLHTVVPMAFKDLVGRYQTMRGRYVPRQAGWDTHGLPVEVQIEKKLGLSGKKEILGLVPGDEAASIERFNQECRDSVWEFKQEWDRYVPRVGYWVDTEKPYVTYETEYVEKTWGVFKKIWDQDLVYKGYKVVPFCPRCGTPLSSHEVAQEYHDTKDVSVFISFPLTDKPERSILAWTTTPWTLPGNVALAVGTGIDYVAVRQEDREYVLAKSRLAILKGDYVILEEMKGKDLVGLAYQPLYPDSLAGAEGKKHLVVAADFVSTEDGTGVVHTAVMYGVDDFELGQKAGLAQRHTVGPDGRFLDTVKEFAGMYIKDALGSILTDLTAKGRLYAKETITHSYPFCWRCKTALMYYATDSWFIAMSQRREALQKANSEVEWYPKEYKDGRYGDFIKEARDWAVSRERFWGTPLPIWSSAGGKRICIGSLEELRTLAKDPDKIGSDFNPHRPYIDQVVLVKDGEEYRRETGILDVWFDSGAMPYASGRYEQGLFPADYIAEATDQTRGWFYTLQAISTLVDGRSSYKRVVCMGLLLDEHGKKMSKSVGNVFDPWEILGTYGADAVRWFLYTVNSPGEAKSFGIKEMQTAFRKSILLLWNVFNYYVTYAGLAKQERPDAGERQRLYAEDADIGLLDRWILSRQDATIAEVTAALERYDFMRAGRLIEQHIDGLSTWYLRRSRKREDRAFFVVLYETMNVLSRLLAPFTPFVSEKIYQVLKSSGEPLSVHLNAWPAENGCRDLETEALMDRVRQVVELGLSLRASEKIKVRQPLAAAYLSLSSGSGLPPEAVDILCDELNVGRIEVSLVPEEGMPSRSAEGLTVSLDTRLTDSLVRSGQAREFLRQVQQLRKSKGMQPGEEAVLLVGPSQRSAVEPLLEEFPFIIQDAYLRIDPSKSWHSQGEEEIQLDGNTLLIGLE